MNMISRPLGNEILNAYRELLSMCETGIEQSDLALHKERYGFIERRMSELYEEPGRYSFLSELAKRDAEDLEVDKGGNIFDNFSNSELNDF